MKVRRILPRFATLFAGWLAISMMAGCTTTMSFGTMPRIEKLQFLKGGASSTPEVVAALGEPRGRGQARFGAELPDQQVWFYEYMQSDGRKVQLKMLLVFMEKDTYMGHMWFSSSQLMGATR